MRLLVVWLNVIPKIKNLFSRLMIPELAKMIREIKKKGIYICRYPYHLYISYTYVYNIYIKCSILGSLHPVFGCWVELSVSASLQNYPVIPGNKYFTSGIIFLRSVSNEKKTFSTATFRYNFAKFLFFGVMTRDAKSYLFLMYNIKWYRKLKIRDTRK
jgi:hypothetical protein